MDTLKMYTEINTKDLHGYELLEPEKILVLESGDNVIKLSPLSLETVKEYVSKL